MEERRGNYFLKSISFLSYVFISRLDQLMLTSYFLFVPKRLFDWIF